MAEEKEGGGAAAGDDLRRGADALFQGVGAAAMVMARAEEYRGLFLGDLRRMVVPPVVLQQYRIVQDKKGGNVGFVAWARVDGKVRDRLMRGRAALKFEEWQCGDETAVMILAAPSRTAGRKMLQAMLGEDFAGHNKVWIAPVFGARGGMELFAADGERQQ